MKQQLHQLQHRLLLLLLLLFATQGVVNAQCTTGFGLDGTNDNEHYISYKQGFQVSCTGVLNTITFTPTGANTDLIAPADNIAIGARLLNASGTVLASATIDGNATTNTWGIQVTKTFSFSAANITLAANTQYSWELFEVNSTRTLNLLTRTAVNSYPNGVAVGDGNTLTGDFAEWSVDVAAIPSDRFITTWTNTSGSFTSLQFNALTAGAVNYTYTTNLGQSGSGSFNQTVINGGVTLALGNTIAANEVLTLVMEPANLRQVGLGVGSFATLLTDVPQWGTVAWTGMNQAFNNCNNLNITATDVPNLSGVTDMTSMFSGCNKLNGPANIGTWNVGTITNMNSLFSFCTVFNQNLSAWNVSNVTKINAMFYFTAAFNNGNSPGIKDWNTSRVTEMQNMFTSATAFNQPIGSWDVSKVTTFVQMFENATVFNQDLSNWNVSQSIGFTYMFKGAAAFNQNLGKWVFKQGGTYYNFLHGSGISCKNYSATLVGWAANAANQPNNVKFEVSPPSTPNLIFGTDAAAAIATLQGKGWTFANQVSSGTACLPTPSLSTIADQATCDGTTISNIAVELSGDEDATLSATDTSSTINPTYTFTGTGGSRYLTIATTSGQVGATAVQVIATSSFGTKDTVEFLLELGNKTIGLPTATAIATGLDNPIDVAIDNQDNLYVSSENLNKIVKVAASTFAASDFKTGIVNPYGLAFDSNQNLFIATASGALVKITAGTNAINLVNTSSSIGNSNLALAYQSPSTLYTSSSSTIYKLNTDGTGVSTLQNGLSAPFGLAVRGNDLYAAYGGIVYKYTNGQTPATAYTSTVINTARGMVFDAAGNLYVAGAIGVYLIPAGGGVAQLIISQGGFKNGMAINSLGEVFYTESGSDNLYKINPGTVSYTPCNAKPVFTNLSTNFKNDTVCVVTANTFLANRQITVSDPDGSIASTVVSSSNTALIEVTNISANNNLNIAVFQHANASGTATIKILSTDNLGAKDSVSFVIKVNAVVIDSTTGANVLCFGNSTGALTVSPTGGTAPYSYSWTKGGSPIAASTGSATSLSAGTYNVTVTDKFNCSNSRNLSISQPAAPLSISKDSSNISCFGAGDGFASAKPTGGTEPYTWLWNDNSTSHEVINQGPGTKSVTVTDFNGCKAAASFSLSQPEEILIGNSPTDATVCEGTDTILGAIATGGTLTYQWYRMDADENSEALSNGTAYQGVSNDTLIVRGNVADNGLYTYYVRAFQSPSCHKVSKHATVTARVCNISPSIASISDKVTCENSSTEFTVSVSDTDFDDVQVTASSNNPTLLPASGIKVSPALGAYNAAPRTLTLTPAVGQSGTVKVMVLATDERNGTDTVYFNLTVNTLPAEVSLSYIAPVCENTPDFTLTQGSPAGGVYTINNEEVGSFSPGNLLAGSHRVVYTVESENGCISAASQPVTVKAVTSAALAAFAPICLNDDPLTLSGGQPLGGKYSGTSVVNGVFNPSLAATGTHTITYSYTNTNNCTDTAQAAIEVKSAPQVNLSAVAACINDVPFALAEKTNVVGSYSGTGVSNNVFNPKVAGVGKTTVTVVVSGENGCQTSKSFQIEVKAGTALSFTTLESLCADTTAINLLATPTGGSFSGAGVSGDTFSPAGLAAGKYALVYTYTADNGCVETMSDTVRVKAVPSPVISATAEQFCPAGEVRLSTTEFDSYQWISSAEPIENATSDSLTVNTAGSYRVGVALEGCYGLSKAIDIAAADSLKPVITYTGGGSICAQQAVTLGVNGQYTSYKWCNNGVAIAGASAATYLVSAPGSYTVLVSNGICSGSSAPVVLSATSPVIITTSGQPAICQGSGVTLSASAAASYQWYKDGQSLTGATAQTYQATQAGTYYVHVSDGAGCEANSANIAVTVLALPEPSLTVDGKTEFCFGESTSLFTQSFASYRWKRNGVTIAGATFESYQASQSGSYSVQVGNAQGCKATSAAQTITMHVLPQPSITPAGTTVICEGTAFELMAAPATSNQWYNGQEPINGATAQNLNITQTGAYRVLVGSMHGCENLSAAAIVKVNPAPEVPTVTFVDSLLTSTAAFNYQWFKDGVLLSGANQQTLALTSNGSYYVMVTGSNGCSSRSATSNIVNLTIDNVTATAQVMVYPNPIGNQFTIESVQAGSYQLIDITGKRILTGNFAQGATAVPVHELACGVYQLLIQSKGTSPQVVRLVK